MAVKEDSAHAPLVIHDEKMGYMDAEMGIDAYAYMDMDAHRDLDLLYADPAVRTLRTWAINLASLMSISSSFRAFASVSRPTPDP